MDHLTKEKRSWNMGQIHSKDTAPEVKVRAYLHRHGLRFRICVKDLPGKPDIVLPKYKSVIQIRGCFWHRHEGCCRATTPKSNLDYWLKKFEGNVIRDKKNDKELKRLGWKVLTIWECEVTSSKYPQMLYSFLKEPKLKDNTF